MNYAILSSEMTFAPMEFGKHEVLFTQPYSRPLDHVTRLGRIFMPE
jgi:hypothetical protein